MEDDIERALPFERGDKTGGEREVGGSSLTAKRKANFEKIGF